MDRNSLIRREDLVNNPTPRVPVCLCLDTSASMLEKDASGRTSRIEELQSGVELFFDAIRSDEVAVYSAEICLVTFDSAARCLLDFANIDRQGQVPRLTAAGLTAMGEGVNLALDLLEMRKKEYRDKGVDYYQPWLVLMTDGRPNNGSAELARALTRTVDAVNRRKLTVFPIGIGERADMDTLNQFSPRRPALRLQGLKFREFFAWLSQSVSEVSQSIPGESFKLHTDTIKSWAEPL